ncbi:MAG TPA: hypothetical protein VF534_11335 [Paraburkholderia sp.]
MKLQERTRIRLLLANEATAAFPRALVKSASLPNTSLHWSKRVDALIRVHSTACAQN